MASFSYLENSEQQLEKLLPHLTEFELSFPEAPSSQKNNGSSSPNARTVLFTGEKVTVHLKIYPKILRILQQETNSFSKAQLEQINLFRSVFNVGMLPTMQRRQEFFKECIRAWKKVFAELYIQARFSPSLEQPSTHAIVASTTNSLTGTFSTAFRRTPLPSFEIEIKKINKPASATSTTTSTAAATTSIVTTSPNNVSRSISSISLNKSPSLDLDESEDASQKVPSEEESLIDFYVYKSKNLLKQMFEAQASFLRHTAEPEPAATSEEEEDLTPYLLYKILCKTGNSTGHHFMAFDINISSTRFAYLAEPPKGLSDNEFNLELLIPNLTPLSDIPYQIFIGSVYKPMIIQDVLQVHSQSKLFSNMKNFIQLTLENCHPETSVTVRELHFHLATSNVSIYGLYNETSSASRAMPRSTSTMRLNKNVDTPQLSPSTLFQYFIDTSVLPIVLKPLEQFTILFVVYPNDRLLIEAGTEQQQQPQKTVVAAAAKRIFLEVPSEQKNNLSSSSSSRAPAVVSNNDQNLCTFETLVDVEYTVDGLSCTLTRDHFAKWNAALKRGLFAILKVGSTRVKLNTSFIVKMGISNYTKQDCDLVLSSQTPSTSGLSCHDNQIEVGRIPTSDYREVDFRFTALQEGFHTISEIYCLNKITKQEYVFPFMCQIFVYRE